MYGRSLITPFIASRSIRFRRNAITVCHARPDRLSVSIRLGERLLMMRRRQRQSTTPFSTTMSSGSTSEPYTGFRVSS